MSSRHTPVPGVDVVILSLNRVELTESAVRSVLVQEGVQLDVWLVDQGSNEASLERLRSLEADDRRVHLIELGENRGVPAGRNVGVRAGEHAYIVSIDNDARFADAGGIRRAVDRLEQDSTLGGLSFRILDEDSGTIEEGSWVHARSSQECSDEEFLTGMFVGCGHALRRDAVEEVGGYDGELFFMCEERELSLRLISSGYRVLYFPEVTVLHKTATEERVLWGVDRYYYLVRNTLYIQYKHWGFGRGFMFRLVGFPAHGVLNGTAMQALRGVRDAIRMCVHAHRTGGNDARLSAEGDRYLALHEAPYRGSFRQRLTHQLLWRQRD